MRRLLLPLLLLTACSADPEPQAAEPSASQPAAAQEVPVEIETTYRGHSRFETLSPLEPPSGPPSRMVIRDAEQLAAFLETVPKKRIQKRQPAPPSEDPILKLGAFDFAAKMLVVVRRSDTMYVHPEIESVVRDGDVLRVKVVHPPLGETIHAAAVMDMGTYCAAVVPAFTGEVIWD